MKVEKFERITLDERLIKTLNGVLTEAAVSWCGTDVLLLAQIFADARKVTVIAKHEAADNA